MAKFIEVHLEGRPIMVNLDYVEEIEKANNGKCTIYQSFNCPDASEQDYIKPDETYDEVRLMIGSAQGGIPLELGGSY